MGDENVIPFPLARREAQIAAEIAVEYVQDPGWFGVRLRPGDVTVACAPPGILLSVSGPGLA